MKGFPKNEEIHKSGATFSCICSTSPGISLYPIWSKKSLWVCLSIAEKSALVSDQDEYDASRGALLINNKTSLQSMRRILSLSKCEKCFGGDTVPLPYYYVGERYIGCDIYFDYQFLFSHYHFVFPSSSYSSWQEYIGGIQEDTPGYGFVLKG